MRFRSFGARSTPGHRPCRGPKRCGSRTALSNNESTKAIKAIALRAQILWKGAHSNVYQARSSERLRCRRRHQQLPTRSRNAANKSRPVFKGSPSLSWMPNRLSGEGTARWALIASLTASMIPSSGLRKACNKILCCNGKLAMCRVASCCARLQQALVASTSLPVELSVGSLPAYIGAWP